MNLKQLPSEFQEALPILEAIREAGFEAYFVGGSVRDALLGRPIHDVDIATSSYPQETKAIFPRTVDVGIEHGTVLVLTRTGEYEITTFRTEEDYVDFRRPSQVAFVRSLEEDLKRRDFTVNAFALDEKGQLIDLFGGLADLKDKVLRAVGNPLERFGEDALRILRGVRFAASLDFQIEPVTFAAMVETAPLLAHISVERSFIECDKLLSAPHWKKGLLGLLDSGAYTYLPDLAGKRSELAELVTSLREGYRFQTPEQAWAMLIVALGDRDPASFLKKWKTSREFQKTVSQLVAAYRYREQASLNKQQVYQYGTTCLTLVEDLRAAQELPVELELLAELDAALTIHSRQEIVVNGGQLMAAFSLKPGPFLGSLLKQIETQIVEGELANEEEAILAFVNERVADE